MIKCKDCKYWKVKTRDRRQGACYPQDLGSCVMLSGDIATAFTRPTYGCKVGEKK